MKDFTDLKGRTWQGVVVKKASEKTAAVCVTRIVENKLYELRYKRRKIFQAHDEMGVTVGEKVVIQECPRVSKTKHTVIIRRVS